MGRTVSALVTCDDDYLGAVGPFGVDIPWWAEAEPVAARLRAVLGVPVIVLRLLRVDGGEGARDGHVTYHVAALSRPAPGLLASGPAVPADVRAELDVADERRSPWARLEGVLELLGWASDVLAAARRPVTGAAVQRKAWNLAALFQLPAGPAPVWLKATPRFAADEASVIAAFAHVDPALVPPVIGAGPGRVLLEHLPGEDCWDASPEIIASAVRRLVTAQAALASRLPAPLGSALPSLLDRRTPVIAGQIRALLDGPVASELSAGEAAAARDLLGRFAWLDECGLPDTLVHGDFHPGNWRSDGGAPAVVDWADAHLGNPVLDGLRACDFLPAAKRPAAAQAWVEAWSACVPGCDPARALRIAAPLAHLAYAVRYQEFLDGIEPSERVYHRGDPAAAIRAALRSAETDKLFSPGERYDPGNRDHGHANGEAHAVNGTSPTNGEEAPAQLDTSEAHSARVWNYLLGGKDNFAADRQTGDLILKMFPAIAHNARVQRRFLARAVRYLAGEAGIRQFLDIGTGLPTADNTHQIAQQVAPESRIVYVDNDPLVLVHAQALLTSAPGGKTSYVEADVRDPDRILSEAAGILDLGQPVALMMLGIMGQIDDSDEPGSIVSRLLATLPSGSYLALSDGTDTNPEMNQAIAVYNQNSASSYHLRSPEQITAFFDGLDVVPPGVVSTSRWRPDLRDADEEPREVDSYAGVARKP